MEELVFDNGKINLSTLLTREELQHAKTCATCIHSMNHCYDSMDCELLPSERNYVSSGMVCRFYASSISSDYVYPRN